MHLSSSQIEEALQRVGERLYADGVAVEIVVAGGAALSLLGVIERATSDVDVIAWREPEAGNRLRPPPDPLPAEVGRAVDAVGAELGLIKGWFDLRVATQWRLGLPDGFAERVTWRTVGRALHVGLAAREDLICFKLVAAADGQHPRHLQDLLRLAPTDSELAFARAEADRTSTGIAPDLDLIMRQCVEARHG